MLQIFYSPWLFWGAMMAPPHANPQKTLAYVAKGIYLDDED